MGGCARLVDEEDAGHNVSLALLPPLGNFGVYLLPHLSSYLARVACKERQEALRRGPVSLYHIVQIMLLWCRI